MLQLCNTPQQFLNRFEELYGNSTQDGTSFGTWGASAMIEFLVVAGIAGGVAVAVASGISLGSRYVDAKLRYEEQDIRLDRPVLAHAPRREKMREEHAA